jgi:chemotaxis protein methyltransferase CheR
METSTFRRFCAIAYEKAGITLGDSKEALVEARVGKRMRALGIANEKEYLVLLEKDPSGEEIVQFLDVISTNHTSFFREPDHFEFMRSVLADWRREGMRKLRVWSAASSTGEEPYTIAFTIADALESVDNAGVDWRILATDISTKVLAKAEAGIFADAKLTGLARGELNRFFERGPEKNEHTVRPAMRTKIAFRRLNLITPPYPMRGPFDIIFCRNVMIYFDQAVRQKVISGMERLLRPGGYLLIGHAEALSGVRTELRMIRPSIFLQSDAAAEVAQ